MNWIQGLKFIDLADYVFRPYGGDNPFNHIGPGDYRHLENTLNFDNLKDGDIIYTHTFYIDQLFRKLDKGLKLTVISHNCDTPAELIPPDGVTWFTSNVNIAHPKVIALPFGIQDDKYYPEIGKRQKMLEKLKETKNFKNLLYIDHRIWVNPKERRRPYELLADKPWVTAIHTEDSDRELSHETPGSFDRYLDNLYNHPFVICPEGNGIDTCRPWEALYMRTIPIVKRCIHYSYGRIIHLPIVVVRDWDQISIELLFQMLNIDSRSTSAGLDFDYWKNLIYENSYTNGRYRREIL